MSRPPAPLTPRNLDISHLPWFPLQHKRLLGSDWWMSASDLARSRNMDLWCEAFVEVPAASLPDNDHKLADLAGFGRDVHAFRAVKAEIMAPWVLCSDGRWYHPTLAEIALECAERASGEAAARAADAERKRIARAKSKVEAAAELPADEAVDAADGRFEASEEGIEFTGVSDASGGRPADVRRTNADRPEDLYITGGYISPPTPPSGGTRTPDRRREEGAEPSIAARREAAFQRAFAAFPMEGRGSSSLDRGRAAFLALVEAADPNDREDPDALADAAVAYAAWVAADPTRRRRVPSFHAWLRRGNYQVFRAKRAAVEPPAWPGPPDLLALAIERCGEDWVRYSLSACGWRDLPTRAVVCRSRRTRDRVLEKLGPVLADRGVVVVVEAAA